MSLSVSETGVTVKTEQVDMVSVVGHLDDAGLAQLGTELELLRGGSTRYLVADLSRVHSCDRRLFELLSGTHLVLAGRGGWMRLVGLGAAVLDALDEATVPEVLLVYRASDWAGRLAH